MTLVCSTLLEAADYIEELMMETARLDAGWHKANVRALDLGMKALDTKLKLSKAMEALRCLEIAATGAGVHHLQERKILHEQIALTRAVLAELEAK
jgi:hypothetical protein